MIDLQRNFHTGLAVTDIEAAMQTFGKDLGLEWAPVMVFDPLPFWTPEKGLHELKVAATYSRQGPHHLELVTGPAGSFYDPSNLPDNRHIGIWVDDLTAEVQRLIDKGWKVLGCGDSPENGYGMIAYLAPPLPGLLIELVSTALKPTIDEWING